MTDQKADQAKAPVKEASTATLASNGTVEAASAAATEATEVKEGEKADQTDSRSQSPTSLIAKVEQAIGMVKERFTGAGR